MAGLLDGVGEQVAPDLLVEVIPAGVPDRGTAVDDAAMGALGIAFDVGIGDQAAAVLISLEREMNRR